MNEPGHRSMQDENVQLRHLLDSLSARLHAAQTQVATMSAAMVAAATLHAAVDRPSAIQAINEVVVNLVGSERFAVLGRRGGAWSVLAATGIDAAEVLTRFTAAREIRLDEATGQFWIGDEKTDPMLVCVPLAAHVGVIGAVVIFGLLPQKAGLASADYELFELLATQGAAALHNSSLHSSCAEEGASA